MRKYLTDLKYLIPLWVILLVVFILTWTHQGDLIIDCGREVFYPQQILNGQVLYKDLFNIYGPFSYLFNAFLYKMMGISLNTLYLSGMFVSFGIVTIAYLISRLFFEKFLSFSVAFLTLITGCFSFYIFNYIFPYSFAVTYGLFAFLIALYCLLLFLKLKNIELYYLSAFFASIAVCSKYEFILFLLVYIFVEYKLKMNIKRLLTAFLIFLIMPIFLFGLLLHEGLTIPLFWQNVKDIINLAHTQTLKYFYILSGLGFQKETLGLLIRSFLKTLFPLLVLIGGFYFYDRKKIIAWSFFVASAVATWFMTSVETFIFLPLLLLILMIVKFTKQDLLVQVLSVSALLVSFKVFWATVISSYGIFFIPILLIAIICFVNEKYRKPIAIYFLIIATVLTITNFSGRKIKSVKLSTEKGTLYIQNEYKDSIYKLVDFIKINTNKTDKVVILPEGLFINFLTDRKTVDYYESLTPLYIETFGEKRIIKDFEKQKPEYIILHNYPTSNYYFKSICEDYGLQFCNFVQKNYNPKTAINGQFKAYVFEIK